MRDETPRDADQSVTWLPANPNYRSSKLTVIDPLAWHKQAPADRHWIVNGWVPFQSVTMLSGDGGIGKSLLAQQLVTCAAAGKDWLGRRTRQCKALYIGCEDDKDEMHRRQVAINTDLGIDMTDVADLALLPRVGDDNLLMEFGVDRDLGRDHGAPTEFWGQLWTLVQDHGAQLIVLDSLYDFFGGNENSRPQARQFINVLHGLAVACDGAVVVCAHPSLSGLSTGSGLSGSTAWNNAVRSRLYLTNPNADGEGVDGEGDADERVLRRKKANYSSLKDEIRLRWSEGTFVVVEEPGGMVGSINRRNAETVFMELLEVSARAGRHVSDSPNSGSFAPKVFAKSRGRQGFKMRDLYRAMESLFADHKIKVESYGAPSTNSREIVAVEG